jgi:hypothetical protein
MRQLCGVLPVGSGARQRDRSLRSASFGPPTRRTVVRAGGPLRHPLQGGRAPGYELSGRDGKRRKCTKLIIGLLVQGSLDGLQALACLFEESSNGCGTVRSLGGQSGISGQHSCDVGLRLYGQALNLGSGSDEIALSCYRLLPLPFRQDSGRTPPNARRQTDQGPADKERRGPLWQSGAGRGRQIPPLRTPVRT